MLARYFPATFFALAFPVSLYAQVESVIAVVGGGALIGKAGDELDDSIARAEAAGHGLLDKANAIGKERLDQIDQITQRAIREAIGLSEKAAIKILEKAAEDIDALRVDIMADLKGVVWEAACQGKKLLMQALPTSLGGLGTFLDVTQFELTPPVYRLNRPTTWFEKWYMDDPYIIEIKEPFDRTYVTVRDVMEASIAPDVISDDTPAHHIVSTWEYLADFALRTSCFFDGSSDRWNQEYVNYREQARQWRELVFIRIE